MTEQLINLLPVELAEMAQVVSVEKRNEVQTVLNNVFSGASKMREQLDRIEISDENDKTNMKLANTIRLGVRQVRLEAEKTFDAKRAEVQAQMLSYRTEDQLWLKAKQTMQILTKEIEENARWKEETSIRFEAEQKELRTRERMVQIAKFAPSIHRLEFENMSDQSFLAFLTGIEKSYNDKIEAQRIAEEARIAKEKAEAAERERIRVENERLKAEFEAKEKQLAEERAKADAERKALEEKARLEREESERILKAEQESARIAAKALEAERALLEAELKAKKEAEDRAAKEAQAKAEAERMEKILAEKKAKSAPDKAKLIQFANFIENLDYPELKSEEANMILSHSKKILECLSREIIQKSEVL